MCVFYQYLKKEASFKRSPLCLSDGDEFTKEGSRRSPPVPNLQVDVAQLSFLFYDLMICFIIHYFYFVLSFLKLKILGGLLDILH